MAVPKGTRIGGRQKGTPNKATADVKAAAQKYTDEALKALASIMRDSDSDAAKVAAIREILDRGHGKPKQSVEASGPDGGPIATSVSVRFVDVPDDEG